METVIKILMLFVAVSTGLLLVTECWNMAIVIRNRKGNASISVWNAIMFIVSLYIMTTI